MNKSDTGGELGVQGGELDWKAGVHTPSFRAVQVIPFAHDV